MVLFFFILFSIQEIIEINDQPSNTIQIEIEEIVTIDGGEDGFYNRIYASMTSDHRIVVYDKGNYEIKIFDLEGKELTRFGREGNGPRELSRVNLIVQEDRIYLLKSNYMEVYTSDGEFLFDTPVEYGNRKLWLIDDKIRVYIGHKRNAKIKYWEYSKAGKFIHEVKNENYAEEVEDEKQDMSEQMVNNIRKSFQRVRDITFDGLDRYQQYRPGSYRIEILDENYNTTHVLTNKIMNKRKSSEESTQVKVSDGQGNTLQKAQNAMLAELIRLKGGFDDDIRQINGYFDNYLFVTHVDNDKEITDVFDENYKLVAHFNFDQEHLKSWQIIHGKIIASYKDPDEGLYLKVYSIKIN